MPGSRVLRPNGISARLVFPRSTATSGGYSRPFLVMSPGFRTHDANQESTSEGWIENPMSSCLNLWTSAGRIQDNVGDTDAGVAQVGAFAPGMKKNRTVHVSW